MLRFSCCISVFWNSDSDSSRTTVYIDGWKRLDPPPIWKNILAKLSFEKVCIKPDQWLTHLFKNLYKHLQQHNFHCLRSNLNTREFNSRELVQSFQLYWKRSSPFLTIFWHNIALFFPQLLTTKRDLTSINEGLNLRFKIFKIYKKLTGIKMLAYCFVLLLTVLMRILTKN